MKFSRTCHYKT